MQKALLDSEALVAKLTDYVESTGMQLSDLDYLAKTTWTEGDDSHDILERLYPRGYHTQEEFMPDGKFKLTRVM